MKKLTCLRPFFALQKNTREKKHQKKMLLKTHGTIIQDLLIEIAK